MNYIPLHVISGYSFLSSGLKVEDIVRISKQNKLDFCCCSEYENMYSFPHLNELALSNNLKPIFGMGLNLKINEKELLVFLYVQNEVGYRNLCALLNLEKNLKNLNEHAEGLILVVPTISNEHLSDVLLTSEEDFAKVLFALSKNFENTYLGIEYYSKDNKKLIEKYRDFASSHSYKKVCFPKHLYEKKNDALTLRILEAIKNEEKIESKEERDGPYFFLGERAVNTLYTKDEIKNTYEIASLVDFELMKKRGKLLEYPITSNLPINKYLEFACLQNAKKLGIELNDKYLERLNYEINIIDKMGYCSYFLIVQDYVMFAKTNNIPVGPGRGSAAGSLVSYLLGITEIDPLKYNLMFERFLNPERVTMPDIDIDIADYARQDVIDYIYRKYGKERMANIITFQTIGAKQSLRDIGRVFSINNSDINALCKQIKQVNISLDESIKANKEFAELYKDTYFKRIIDLARKIEGFPRQESLHAAGIIINNDSMLDIIPTKLGSDNRLVSEFEAPYLEKLGFLKMDILGLKNLSIIKLCVDEIKQVSPTFDLSKIPLNDHLTFDILNAGLTQGIFQLESEGITSALKKIKVTSYDDIVALLALYRPGPMDNIEVYARRKNNNERIEYLHPLIEEILRPTYGVIIYQEQIMEIVQKIASFSLSEADLFRRAISKKDKEKLEGLKKQFVTGATKNNIPLVTSEKIFDLIYKFANYGFNKSHSVSYALITYQLAYLKANYPLYFFSTMLTSQANSIEKYTKYKNDFNLFQIKLLLPNVNSSELIYIPKNEKILLPLTAIKGLPTNLSQAIVFERKKGPYTSLDDVISRLLPYGFTNAHFMALINSGALDGFKMNRQTLRKALPTLIQYVETTSQEVTLLSKEEMSRFRPLIKEEKEDKDLDLEEEYNVLGTMISGSLFDRFSNYITRNHIQEIFTVSSMRSTTTIGIIITKVKEILTRSNKKMAIVTGFDNSQEIDVTFFDNEYQKFKNYLEVGRAVALRGYFRASETYGISFICENLELMEENK